MKPVMQSKLYCEDGIHNGNCFAACLASLLELPLWMVPPFEDMFARYIWSKRSEEWLDHMFGLTMTRLDGHPNIDGYYIANGISDREIHHSVIYHNGTLAHDPYPTGTGIRNVDWCWELVPRNDAMVRAARAAMLAARPTPPGDR